MTLKRFCLLLILLLGALLRFGGQGYGLALQESYHPDTPKQIRAVDSFLRGDRYMHIGARDYDGYPLFTSYLTSRLIAATWPVARRAAMWIGTEELPARPSFWGAAWTMAFVNATLATLAILLAWRIGCTAIGAKAGLAAALFLALSPGDIAACHYASGDTGAAFFALLALFFALRMHRTGSMADYAAAAFFAAWAFASKYHGLVAAAPVGLAHLVRPEHLRRWHRPASLRGIGVLAVAYLAGLLIAIPGLREAPVAMVRDILNFMHYASNFGMPEELIGAGFVAKLKFSLARNLPILAGLLGLPVVLALLAALTRAHRDPRVWLLVAGPAVYFLVGVSLRPMAHPVYHTVLTAPAFLLAATGIAGLARTGTLTRGLAAVLAAAAALFLAHAGWRETFFFRHSDTRHLAREWCEENLPSSYAYAPRIYTFESSSFTGTMEKADGHFFLTSSPRNLFVPDQFKALVTFSMERDSLPFFRNFDLGLQLHDHSSIGPSPLTPLFQRTPSRMQTEVIPAYAPEFVRSPRIFELGKFGAFERLVVARAPITDALIIGRSDHAEARVAGHFGSRTFRMDIPPGGVAVQSLANPRRCLPYASSHWFYDLDLHDTRGRSRIEIAWTARDKGIALFHAGRPGEALPFLQEAALAQRHPTMAALALVAASDAKFQLGAQTEAALRSLAGNVSRFDTENPTYGDWRMASRVFDQLPFIAHKAGALTSESFTQKVRWLEQGARVEEFHSDPTAKECKAAMHGIWLEQGSYRLHFAMHPDGAIASGHEMAHVVVGDYRGVVLETSVNWAAGVNLDFAIDRSMDDGYVRITFKPGTDVILDSLTIRPDAIATLRRLWARIPPPRAN